MTDANLLDPDSTLHEDLRGGCAPWTAGIQRPTLAEPPGDLRTDVLIVGGGITGALVSEHLSRLGHRVCLIDRETPGFGSTAASTAMLQWEIDCSLTALSGFYGFERAARLYHRSLRAVDELKRLVAEIGIPCDFRPKSSLYLAGGDGAAELASEHALRRRAGLPGVFLDYPTLKREFGFARAAAILSPGSADADPLRLAWALMASASARGTRLFDAEAVSYESGPRGVAVTLGGGQVIEAGHVVLATGYVMPDFVRTDLHKTAASWAIATRPQAAARLWRDGVLIWEASETYLYARTLVDGRIVIGGEDDDTAMSPAERDRLMPAKARILLEKLARLWPEAEARAEFVWAGAFGETQDGLPLIGQVPGHPRIHAAYGYGGNGITFSYMASRLIARQIAGQREAWHDEFALDRPRPGP